MKPVILTDIEGTTSSISFVKDVLFPYAFDALPEYVRQHSDTPAVAGQIAAIHERMGGDASLDQVVAQLLQWIEEDAKVTPLKALQGQVWEHGYRSGAYRSHVYPDAHDALRAWHDDDIPIYVYSSGSIQAQRLFFEFTIFGDLTGLFRGHFDTTTGPKKHAASYETIARTIARPAHDIVFLSDVLDELCAARSAGMDTRWLVRPEDTQVSAGERESSGFETACSFAELML